MEKKDIKTENKALNEKELENVNGGCCIEGDIVCSNLSTYESGDSPKYKVNDRLIVEFEDAVGYAYDCHCIVRGVSSKKDGGLIYKEFTYTVEITSVHEHLASLSGELIGKIYTGVYESSLH